MREYDLDDILAEYASSEEETAGLTEPEWEPEAEAKAPAVRPEAPENDGNDGLTRIFEPMIEETAPEEEPEAEEPETEEEEPVPEEKPKAKKKKNGKRKKESFGKRLGFGVLSLIFAAVSLVALLWSLQNLHPDTSAASEATRSMGSTNLVSRLDAGLNNSKANALSDITYIPKHYSIPENDNVAPRPNEACFGSVSPDQASSVMDIIQQARDSGLLEGQDTVFSPDLNFKSNTNIQYYCDDTILTIIWKELIEGNTVTCCEVKVADASQFRRKFVDDTFGSSNKLFATSLAASVNSVVAMNADFYMFRDFGIVVYNRDLKRFSEANYTGSYKKYNCTDTMFVTDQGDFLFWHRLQEATLDQMRAYIAENNILFSIAFGPVLVENGELQVCDWYPAGEINSGYSRAGIGQKDHLHYFYMSLNHSTEKEARWTVNHFGERMFERGLQQAYCLDGGQTSEIVWRGAPFNYIDFGGEREVSDIIYFATAIPETEGTP